MIMIIKIGGIIWSYWFYKYLMTEAILRASIFITPSLVWNPYCFKGAIIIKRQGGYNLDGGHYFFSVQ